MISEESVKLMPRPLSADEEKRCLQLLSDEDKCQEARDVLIKHNMRLVGYIISKRFYNTKTPYEDLFSAGCYGLIRGVDTFDVEKSKLSTYLATCISNEILKELRKASKENGVAMVSMQELSFSNSEGDGLTNEEVIADEDNCEDAVVEEMENQYLMGRVNKYLEKAGGKKRKIIEKTFGLNGEKVEIQVEIAKSVGCSQCNVSRVVKETLKELQNELKK